MAKPLENVLPPRWDMTAQELRLRQMNSWSEKQFQDAVITTAKSMGYTLIYHTYDSRRSEPGFPDLILIHPGKGITLWRELKSAKGRLSPAQKKWIEGARAAGNDIDVWRPADLASERIIRELSGKKESRGV